MLGGGTLGGGCDEDANWASNAARLWARSSAKWLGEECCPCMWCTGGKCE